jgi:hypothetical protein
MIGLPVVTQATADSAIDDLLAEEESSCDGAGLVIDWMRRMEDENPELIKTVTWFGSLYDDEELRSAFLAASAITYRVLSAQAEVTALNAMAGGAQQPFAGILQRFEQQATENFRALNGTDDNDDSYDHEAEQERLHGPYVEGEYPGASL